MTLVTLERREDGVAAITLASPDTGNAISLQWAREFRAIGEQLAADAASVRVVTLGAEGRFFCVGGDVGLFATAEDPYAILHRLATDLHAGLLALRALDAPVIASVQGGAAGAGLSLVLGADLAIASEKASFTVAYTGVGLSPDGGSSYWLPRRVGSRLATELIFTNRWVGAEEAARIGIVNETVPAEQLGDRTEELTTQLANGPTASYGAAKRLLDHSESGGSYPVQLALEADSIASLAAGPTGREGAAAFIAKRRPQFNDARS